MFELYSTSMKTQQLEEEDEELFICHIQSITRSEMCALLLTHPRAHTPGAVDSHTHTWSSGHTNSHKPGAVDTYTPGAVDTHLEQRTHTHTHTHLEQWAHTHLEQWAHTHTHTHTHTHLEQWAHTHTHLEQWKHTHTHTHTHTWSSGQSTLRRPGGSWGFSALLKGLTSVVDISCRSREPTTSDYKSSALSIRPRLPLDYNLQLYFVTSHTVWLSEK